MRFPSEMAERRKVMRKCVFGSKAEEDNDGGEVARAATVREAAVPL